MTWDAIVNENIRRARAADRAADRAMTRDELIAACNAGTIESATDDEFDGI
jgi:hypothetical protein